jgi:hypothetical protein
MEGQRVADEDVGVEDGERVAEGGGDEQPPAVIEQ